MITVASEKSQPLDSEEQSFIFPSRNESPGGAAFCFFHHRHAIRE
jgi:hypothetical protein